MLPCKMDNSVSAFAISGWALDGGGSVIWIGVGTIFLSCLIVIRG